MDVLAGCRKRGRDYMAFVKFIGSMVLSVGSLGAILPVSGVEPTVQAALGVLLIRGIYRYSSRYSDSQDPLTIVLSPLIYTVPFIASAVYFLLAYDWEVAIGFVVATIFAPL